MDIPRIKSAKKQMRQNRKRHAKNQIERESLKQTVKRFKKTADKSKAEASKLIPEMMKSADKAAQSGIIHRKKAARIKSRLMKKLQAKP